MNMALRWFGPSFDSVDLHSIRQIPGISGVISALPDLAAGVDWPIERIIDLKTTIEKHDLKLLGIESVNVHDSIKAGTKDRDFYIERYISTLKSLGTVGIGLVCYNFMPIFDWTRTDLAKMREDGTTVLAYDQKMLDALHPEQMLTEMGKKSNNFLLPGWEPERLASIRELFKTYVSVTEESLFENLVYFLKAILPICEQYHIKMAIHPDDPPWSVFGLPRIAKNGADLQRIVQAIQSPCNCVTLCTGSLGSNPANDLLGIIHSLEGKIAFAHVRNLRHTGEGIFEEAAHYAADGSLDMVGIMQALHDINFDGIMRPDHGRAIWNEVALPGYGLHDRALGSQYLLGLWDAITRAHKVIPASLPSAESSCRLVGQEGHRSESQIGAGSSQHTK